MSWFATSDCNLPLLPHPYCLPRWATILARLRRVRSPDLQMTRSPDGLAGPLGFEPRQSAPKALDLPLVDGPTSIQGLRRKRLCPRLRFARYGAHHSAHPVFQYRHNEAHRVVPSRTSFGSPTPP